MDKVLLFNPTSIVHDRNVGIFRKHLPDWNIRCIYNPRLPWFSDKGRAKGAFYFSGGKFPHAEPEVFKGVDALVLFTAQARVPSCGLVEEAARRRIPVIAVEEVHMMMLEYGYINNYVLPVDRLFVTSEYERNKFLEIGNPQEAVEATGCVFAPKKSETIALSEKKRLKAALGLSSERLTATLCLSFLFPGGETLDIRKRLITMLSRGLPKEYELFIKPHPSELDKNMTGFIRSFAPDARIAGTDTPIEKVLDVTDVLFNRGNSQVVVDALQRQIPVIIIPAGRLTAFHGLSLNDVIVDKSEDVASALNAVKTDGMKIYDNIFRNYLSISQKSALETALRRMVQIAENREMRDPAGRLTELSLFWAWMGYDSQALVTLLEARPVFNEKSVSESMEKLIKNNLDRSGMACLRQWAGTETYREWILKSLWIKSLYLTGERMSAEDAEWLSGYPPRMNRGIFLPYAYKLYWCYLRSDLRNEAEKLLSMLIPEFDSLEEVGVLENHSAGGPVNNSKMLFWDRRIKYAFELAFRDLAWRARIFFKASVKTVKAGNG